jgi:hypothetical protein
MTDVVKKIRQGIAASQMRTRDLQAKLAELPDDSGPEVRVLFERQLAKEKKYQAQMALAMAEPPLKKSPSIIRIMLLTALLMILVYLLVFR